MTTSPAPDLGPVQVLHDPTVPGGVLVNMAGVLELARTGDTPESKRFYSAFVEAWHRLTDDPMPLKEKQATAFEAALSAIKARH